MVLRTAVAGLMAMLALPVFGMQPEAKDGFRHFYNLEYDQALDSFQHEAAAHPNDPDGHNHVAQTILYRALYRSGSLENSIVSGDDLLLSVLRQPKLALSEEDARMFQMSVQRATDAAETRLKAQPNDTTAMYALGVAHGLRANYDFLVRKSYLSAIRASNTARKLHNHVAELDPSNVDATMMQGIHEYVVASLPGTLRFLGAITGMHGDKATGLRTLTNVATHGSDSRADAGMLLVTLLRHEKRPAEALPVLQGMRESYPRNYLLQLAEIYTFLESKDEHSATEALHGLETAYRANPAAFGTFDPAKTDYTRGLIASRFGRYDEALALLRQVTSLPTTREETRLLAYQQQGMIHDLRGQRSAAIAAYQKVVSTAPNSRSAKEAQRYISHRFDGAD